MEWLNQIEVGILHSIYETLECAFLDKVMPVITSLGDAGIFWIVLAVIFLFFKKTRRAGISMAFSLIFGLILCNLTLKPLVARIRPYDFDPTLQSLMLVEGEHDFSFPSGHTIASIEAAFALWFNNKKLGTPAVILAFIIAFSRLYLVVHYPTDVLTSVVLGILLGFLACKLADWLIKKTKIPCAD